MRILVRPASMQEVLAREQKLRVEVAQLKSERRGLRWKVTHRDKTIKKLRNRFGK